MTDYSKIYRVFNRKRLWTLITDEYHWNRKKKRGTEEKLDIKRSEVIRGEWKTGHILVEETKNGEVRRVPMNKKLTETLESAKKVSKGEYVFSDNVRPYGDVKTGWWTA